MMDSIYHYHFILPRLSYVGCSLDNIGTHTHGRHVTSLLCQSEVIVQCGISVY